MVGSNHKYKIVFSCLFLFFSSYYLALAGTDKTSYLPGEDIVWTKDMNEVALYVFPGTSDCLADNWTSPTYGGNIYFGTTDTLQNHTGHTFENGNWFWQAYCGGAMCNCGNFVVADPPAVEQPSDSVADAFNLGIAKIAVTMVGITSLIFIVYRLIV